MSPAVRVWSAVYYAIYRDEMGYRSDENLRLLEFAAKESQMAICRAMRLRMCCTTLAQTLSGGGVSTKPSQYLTRRSRCI